MTEGMKLRIVEPTGKIPIALRYMDNIEGVALFELTLVGKKTRTQNIRVSQRAEIWNPNGSILAILEIERLPDTAAARYVAANRQD